MKLDNEVLSSDMTDPPGEALCFDMYGTLCDTSSVAAALGEHLDVAAEFVADVDALWRRTQLRYAQQIALMDAHRPFSTVTERALDYALDFYDLDPSETARREIVAAYDDLDPYPDAADALAELGWDYPVVVLSNGDPEMLETLAENAGLAGHLDDIVSAHEVRNVQARPRGVRERRRAPRPAPRRLPARLLEPLGRGGRGERRDGDRVGEPNPGAAGDRRGRGRPHRRVAVGARRLAVTITVPKLSDKRGITPCKRKTRRRGSAGKHRRERRSAFAI